MSTTPSPLKLPAGQGGDFVKGLLKLLQGAKSAEPAAPPTVQDNTVAELAYKLAQASAMASDPGLLQSSILGLLDALEGLNTALGSKDRSVKTL